MDAEFKQKWIEALRSGKYAQGKRALRSIDGEFCCLGVLCDLFDPRAWDGQSHIGCATAFPDNKVLTAVGTPPITDDHPFWELVEMNDDGASFSQIAAHIEQNL